MTNIDPRQNLLILGVHLKSEGYPNTLYRLQELKDSGRFRIVEINMPMWSKIKANRYRISGLLATMFRAVLAHIVVMIRYLRHSPRKTPAYIPYPGVFVLFLLACLPVNFRPHHLVADVFISLYDTIVLDRCLLRKKSFLAKILKWMERRAYLVADILVVDTEQNKDHLCSLFDLVKEKVVAIPLSTDEKNFHYTPYQPNSDKCQVLFIGTMVPLHGIRTILQTACLLAERPDIHFTLIGDGQEGCFIEECLARGAVQLKWKRYWQSSPELAAEISQADICLGVFGDGKKTQRVCPFKMYNYAAIGRPVITGTTEWSRQAVSSLSYAPFIGIPVGDAKTLAAEIVRLADAPHLRAQLAVNSHIFYRTYLANQLAMGKLISCLIKEEHGK
ncbi:MAG: glycosyltransferase [Desulfopila sp.]